MKHATAITLVLAILLIGLPSLAMSGPSPTNPGSVRGYSPAAQYSSGEQGHRNPTAVQNLDTGEVFATIQEAIDDADTDAGDVLEVQTSPHSEGQVTVNKAVTIQGGGGGATILAAVNTGTSGDARGWFLMTVAGVAFDNLSFDGNGYEIVQGLRFKEDGAATSCSFNDIVAPSYNGLAVVGFKNTTVQDCTFTNIGRVGIILFGADVTAGLVERIDYTGKGDGDWLDYGIELGGGAVATLNDNTIHK